MLFIFLPIAAILIIRQIINYKIITIGNDKIQVWYPFRFNTVRVSLGLMEYWQETIIQTKTGIFKQLDIVFHGKTIKMSIQENSSYSDAVNYFKKKYSRKRKK